MAAVRPEHARIQPPVVEAQNHPAPSAPYLQRALDGWSVVAVTGDLDIATGPGLTAQVGRLIDLGPTSIVLDLAGLDFLDASGITALVRAVHMTREYQGRLRLARASIRSARVLDLAWPAWRLIAFDTLAAAAAED